MQINFQQYSIRIKKENDTTQVFDIVRKRWLVLTPEEEVRQIWLHYLHLDLGYSLAHIAVEKRLKVNQKIKRFDICVFNAKAEPEILIECKAPKVPLATPTLEQLLVYNLELQAKKFVITNGIDHFAWALSDNAVEKINSLYDKNQ